MSLNAEREWKVFQAHCVEGGRFWYDTTTWSILFTESDTKGIQECSRFVSMAMMFEVLCVAAITRKHRSILSWIWCLKNSSAALLFCGHQGAISVSGIFWPLLVFASLQCNLTKMWWQAVINEMLNCKRCKHKLKAFYNFHILILCFELKARINFTFSVLYLQHFGRLEI